MASGRVKRSIPIGRAIDARQILILDRHQRLCPVGVRGEIYVRSCYLTLGYFGRPEETAKRFLQNPLHDRFPDQVYRTGDTGRWLPDGTIEFFGRIDNLVKLRGTRVELGDIESALRLHPSVRDCAVLVRTLKRGRETLVAKEREDARPGAQQVLVAYLTSNQEVSSYELRRFLEERLPAHMVPQQFVSLAELPLNANRKLDVKALPESSRLRPELADSYVAPRGSEEALIAEIWQEVLGIDRVGSNDGFFELGGDSLLAMQALNRLRKATSPDLTFRHLFERPSVAGLAEVVRGLGASQGTASIAPVDPRRRTYPLTLAQQGIWFLWKLDPESPYYTAQGTIHLRGILTSPPSSAPGRC